MNPFAIMKNIFTPGLFCPFDELPVGFFRQVFKLRSWFLVACFSAITAKGRPILQFDSGNSLEPPSSGFVDMDVRPGVVYLGSNALYPLAEQRKIKALWYNAFRIG